MLLVPAAGVGGGHDSVLDCAWDALRKGADAALQIAVGYSSLPQVDYFSYLFLFILGFSCS
jgi:hypothetical protein